MFVELGHYDPSSEYIVNYSDSKTIRRYRKLTEKRIDIEHYTHKYTTNSLKMKKASVLNIATRH